MPALPDARLGAAAFAAALCVYLAAGSGNSLTHDTTPNAYLPVSLLADGDLAFGPLEAPYLFLWGARGTEGKATPAIIQRWDQEVPGAGQSFADYYRQDRLEFQGPRYSLVPTQRSRAETGEPLFVGAFGPATGLTGVPAAAIGLALGWDLPRDPYSVLRTARWTAALLTAGSVAFVLLTALGLTTRGYALLTAAMYALGSCVWTISSQALWQQTAELFFLSLGVFCVVRGDGAWVRGAAAGLAFAAAAACRPTAAIVALAAAGYLLLSDRRAAAAYMLAAAPIALGVAAFNHYYFGSALEFGQLAAGAAIAQAKTGSDDVWQTPLWLGAAGMLVSPSRGLLVYTPVFAAAFAGAVLAWREPGYARLRFLTVAVPALWLPAFLWFDWWGGWTYGYRPIVDSAPLLALLCVPALAWLFYRPAWKAAFIGALAWSVLVQVLGVAAYRPAEWNARPVGPGGAPANIDLPEYRDRLWSWHDWQIGYLIGGLLRPGGR